MEVTKLLEADHLKVEKLLAQLEEKELLSKYAYLFSEIETELELHSNAEEDVLYPEVTREKGLKHHVENSVEEHQNIWDGLKKCRDKEMGTSDWIVALKELKVFIEEHVKKEETKLFPELRKVWSEQKRERLGTEIEASKTKMLRMAS